MLLAAGRGERMRPLSDATPKPLLRLAGRPIIVHLLERLLEAGIVDIVINHAWLGHQLVETLGDGGALGVRIRWSAEPEGALDTGGGIRHALPLLGPEPFLVCNGDVWTDFDFTRLARPHPSLAHLVLVDNPPQHPEGDFVLEGGRVREGEADRLTFSGIGVYRPALFRERSTDRFALPPLLREAMARGEVTGEHFRGRWSDVGTPERLLELNAALEAGRG